MKKKISITLSKISITLSKDVLAELDRSTGRNRSRSAIVEDALREYFRERTRAALYARDLARINAAADRLNAEAEDALLYQDFNISRSS